MQVTRALDALGVIGSSLAIAVFFAVFVGVILAVVLGSKKGGDAEPWLPSLPGALRPEPGPLLAYVIAVKELTMATRAAFVLREETRGSQRDSAWLDEVSGHCAAVKLRGRALREDLQPYLELPGAMAPAADALTAAWSDDHQMLGADGEWSSYHTALARVATREQGQSRHVWILDRDAALAAVDALIAACDPTRFPAPFRTDYELDLDALDADDRGRLDRVRPQASQAIETVWLRGTTLRDQVEVLHGQRSEFLAKLQDFRVKVAESEARFEEVSQDLTAVEPALLVESRQARDWVNDPRLWGVQTLQRAMAAGERANDKLAISVAKQSIGDRQVMGGVLRVYGAVYPGAPAPVVIGLSRLERWGAITIAMVVTLVAVIPMALTLILALS